MSSPVPSRLAPLFALHDDTDYEGTVAKIRAGAELSASNLWSLAFAIGIASVGLNTNSTAVIIGAMLISPLMGPIVGTGLALGTDDITLLRRSIRNLIVATVVALLVSTIYFVISPLADAQSELLARTRPTLYDVLIALFGGAAGFVAGSRRDGGGNVVPGVAIATALMPPLCTAGFGLAHNDWGFFFGAMHLYLINALFICLATLAFVRLLKFSCVHTAERAASRRLHAVILVLTVALVVPSVYTAWSVVQETRFQRNARRFITEQLRSTTRTVLSQDVAFGFDSSTIAVSVLGPLIAPTALDSLRTLLPKYGLARTSLTVRQPLQQSATLNDLREDLRRSLADDMNGRLAAATREQSQLLLSAQIASIANAEPATRQMLNELSTLEPNLESLAFGRQVSRGDSAHSSPAFPIAVLTWSRAPDAESRRRLAAYLAQRLKVDSVVVTHVVARVEESARR